MDRDRLIKLLGMTGSTHVGEAANAAWMAGKLLKDANLTWNDVILPVKPQHTRESAARNGDKARRTNRDSWTQAMRAAKIILESAAPISEWERKFLNTMKSNPRPTQKQMGILLNISRKYGFL